MIARPDLTPALMWEMLVQEYTIRTERDHALRREFVVNHFSGMEDEDIRDAFEREFPAKRSA